MKFSKKILSVLFVAVMTLCLCIPTFAAGGNVTYKDGAEKLVFAPGSEYSPTDLFDEGFKGVMPGDEITEEIEIRNTKDIKVEIFMRSLGEQKQEDSTENFLSQMTLKVEEKSSTLFEAPANETAQLTDWVSLGKLAPDGKAILKVTLNISENLDDDFQFAIGYLDWEFAVKEIPDEPVTGDRANPVLWIVIIAACFVVIALAIVAIFKRKKQR